MLEGAKIYNALEDTIEPAFSANNVPVIFCCDNNYFPHAMTLVASIMAHASPTRNYDLLLFIDEIDPNRLRTAQEWMKKYSNARLRYIDISKMSSSLQMESFSLNARLSTATYFRLLAPEVLKNYQKVVYLDVDIICLEDIGLLYEEDISSYLAGGCDDIWQITHSLIDDRTKNYWTSTLNMEPGSFYFNGGVIVMNLEAIRTEGIIGEAIQKLRSNDLWYHDQDALNAAMNGRVKHLPTRWNCYDWFDEQMSALENEAICRRIVIPRDDIGCHHYIIRKPWNWDYLGNNADLYWQYASETPFHKETWRRLKTNCSLRKMAYLYLKLSVQLWNFTIRQCFSSVDKKKKLAGRIVSLRTKRSAIGRHMWKVRFNKPFEVPDSSKIQLDQRD